MYLLYQLTSLTFHLLSKTRKLLMVRDLQIGFSLFLFSCSYSSLCKRIEIDTTSCTNLVCNDIKPEGYDRLELKWTRNSIDEAVHVILGVLLCKFRRFSLECYTRNARMLPPSVHMEIHTVE